MIAPTNCNPDCDCAQRMVRCQRAAPIDDVARESLVRRNVFLDPPPYVIPASIATNAFRAATETYKNEPDHFIDALRELEEEFPATMGIAPLPEDSLVQQREFTPEENAAFDRADAKMRLVRAFRTCELDCGLWSNNALNELADIAIATLEKK